MRIKTLVALIGIFIFAITLSTPVQAAVVKTKHGVLQGKVIVREFEDVVVTILTEDNRLFQFYAQDVQSVTASEKTLIRKNTELKELPQEDSETVTELSPGLEINILKQSPDDQWTQIEIWGKQQGWISSNLLTNQVTFFDESSKSSGDIQDVTSVNENNGDQPSKEESSTPSENESPNKE